MASLINVSILWRIMLNGQMQEHFSGKMGSEYLLCDVFAFLEFFMER